MQALRDQELENRKIHCQRRIRSCNIVLNGVSERQNTENKGKALFEEKKDEMFSKPIKVGNPRTHKV